MKARRWGRCIAVLILSLRHYMRVGGQHHAPVALPLGKRSGIRFTKGWVRSGRVGKISPPPPTGIRTPNRSHHSESLYWQRYPGRYSLYNAYENRDAGSNSPRQNPLPSFHCTVCMLHDRFSHLFTRFASASIWRKVHGFYFINL
jgi:hypothetical protein